MHEPNWAFLHPVLPRSAGVRAGAPHGPPDWRKFLCLRQIHSAIFAVCPGRAPFELATVAVQSGLWGRADVADPKGIFPAGRGVDSRRASCLLRSSVRAPRPDRLNRFRYRKIARPIRPKSGGGSGGHSPAQPSRSRRHAPVGRTQLAPGAWRRTGLVRLPKGAERAKSKDARSRNARVSIDAAVTAADRRNFANSTIFSSLSAMVVVREVVRPRPAAPPCLGRPAIAKRKEPHRWPRPPPWPFRHNGPGDVGVFVAGSGANL